MDHSAKLPVEVIAHLLGWVPEVQWLQVRLVSKKWYFSVVCLMEWELSAHTSSDGVWKPSLSRTVARRLLLVSAPFMPTELRQSVSGVHLGKGCRNRWGHCCGTVAERELWLSVDHFPMLERLFCPNFVTDTILRDVVTRAPLKSLDLVHCEKDPNRGLSDAPMLGDVTYLMLPTAGVFPDYDIGAQITDAGLGEVAKLSALTSLNLSGCRKITDTGLVEVVKFCPLTSLSLAGCDQITDAGLSEVAKLSALTSLNLTQCHRITESGLDEVVKLSTLTSLTLAGGCRPQNLGAFRFEHITDAWLGKVANLDALTSLALGLCTKITDAGLDKLARLSALTSLYLAGCVKITDAGLANLAKLESLTTLSLFCCEEITDAGLTEVSKLGALTSLDLGGCPRITDVGLRDLPKLRALKFLSLGACIQISDAGLREVEKLESLTTLSLFYCHRITNAGVSELAKRLTFLDLTQSGARERR